MGWFMPRSPPGSAPTRREPTAGPTRPASSGSRRAPRVARSTATSAGVPAYAYVTSESQRSQIDDETQAAVATGLPATLAESTPLPYPVASAVRFDDQAEFHERKYLLGLAGQLAASGARIYENTRAAQVDEDEDCVVKTPDRRVTAGRVVVATHYPFLVRGLDALHAPPLRGQLERGRAQLGLPLPRLPLHLRRPGHPGSGRRRPGAQAGR